jgi:hypothetical protein
MLCHLSSLLYSPRITCFSAALPGHTPRFFYGCDLRAKVENLRHLPMKFTTLDKQCIQGDRLNIHCNYTPLTPFDGKRHLTSFRNSWFLQDCRFFPIRNLHALGAQSAYRLADRRLSCMRRADRRRSWVEWQRPEPGPFCFW